MALEAVGEVFDVAEAASRRSRVIDAAIRSGGVIALGSTIYFGWFLYEFFTNLNVQMRDSLGAVAEVDFPAVDPALASEQAYLDYADLLGVDVTTKESVIVSDFTAFMDRIAEIAPYVGVSPMLIKASRDAVVDPRGQPLKVARFKEAQAFIDESGGFHGMTGPYRTVMDAWAALYDAKLIDSKPRVHPMDKVSRFIVHDKWFWGGVLGIATVPPMIVIADELRKDIASEGAK